MKVTAVEIIPLEVPFIPSMRKALGAEYRPSPFRIARVRTDEGVVGKRAS